MKYFPSLSNITLTSDSNVLLPEVGDIDKTKYMPVVSQEQAVITSALKGKIVVNAEKLSHKVKNIIVRRAKVKSAIEKIAIQEAEFKEINK